jgi:hexosaminidase
MIITRKFLCGSFRGIAARRILPVSIVLAWIFCPVAEAGARTVTLLPAPREARWSEETVPVARLSVEAPGRDAEDLFAADDFAQAARGAGLEVTPQADYSVRLLRDSSAAAKKLQEENHSALTAEMLDEGYVLILNRQGATVVAHSAAGVFYGVQTLRQMLPVGKERAELPVGVVRDWPAMKYRGIDDDLSRGPFPTMDFLRHQIRVFAAFKANVYSPYLEHVLLYPDHPLAAPEGGSLTPEMVRDLVEYARRYHVMVVPEQEAIGHLHHILKYDLYQDVVETPNGHVLAPGQAGTIPLIHDWFQQVAAEFPAPFLHIGADETFDLGQGRTRDAVTAKGYGPVYVDFLRQIHETLKPLHRRLLFWGDIGGSDPAALAQLPKDMIAVPWNYWDTKGFEKMIEPFAKEGIETWVAPGDGNWNEVFPSLRGAFGNIQGFVRDGQKMGSTGALITVWNDDGEGLFNLDWHGVLFGAVAAWQPGESSIAEYQAGYGRLFHGDSSGRIDAAEKKLMAAMSVLSSSQSGYNSDTLFWMDPWSREGKEVSPRILLVAVEMRKDAEEAIELILRARRDDASLRESQALQAMEMGARRIDFIGLKFELAAQIASDYAYVCKHQQEQDKASQLRNMLDEISSMFGRCQDLRDGYSAMKSAYSKVWLSENTPYWLENVTVRYDLRMQEWQRRGERFREAADDFEAKRPLPSPESMGLPVITANGK